MVQVDTVEAIIEAGLCKTEGGAQAKMGAAFSGQSLFKAKSIVSLNSTKWRCVLYWFNPATSLRVKMISSSPI